MLSIKGEMRDISKNNAVRKMGRIPAVMYGRKEKSAPISVDSKEFGKVFAKAGESSVVLLEGPWGAHDVLIHDVSRNPVTEYVEHVDFYVLEKDRKVTVRIPVEFTGIAPAVKDLGGTLVKVMYEIEIEALPRDLPPHVIADISKLTALDSQLLVKDISLPQGVSLISGPEEVVAAVAEYKEEVEAPVRDISDIEVEKKGKVEEEGEGAEGKSAETPEKKA